MSATSHHLDPASLQSRFMVILPRIQLHDQINFRRVKCQCQKEELVAETVALAWKWFVALTKKGKDAGQFVGALATYAARATKCGRRLCGKEKAKDVLSPRAQQGHGFTVSSLPLANAHLAAPSLYTSNKMLLASLLAGNANLNMPTFLPGVKSTVMPLSIK